MLLALPARHVHVIETISTQCQLQLTYCTNKAGSQRVLEAAGVEFIKGDQPSVRLTWRPRRGIVPIDVEIGGAALLALSR